MRSRRKILDATLELIASEGFGGVNIAAAAHAAGVTRQTVYSNFGSREDLVSQAMADLLFRATTGLRSRLAEIDDAAEYIVELFVVGRAVVRDDPILARLVRIEPGNPIFDADMIARAKPIAHELLRPLMKLDPAIEPQLDDIAQIGIRLGLSVVLFDDPDIESDEDLRRLIARWVVPALSLTHR
ncbi:TetR/AcrR family transcriptional regulator [Nocardia sp. CA2R105]|uniref:TetR/AcrR family transcriptional regulator n=1 Tax=Nocardia coffeae TaxID=2873381 RepID=UPI001CA6FE47|nr:TetR/AcrR family transcriptional regulator [Nocardia coffeae]MBY8859926.1 TetR/AcrR family transcriptional regulator [Nocardia coffeae]